MNIVVSSCGLNFRKKRGKTAYNLLKEAMNEFVTPLQLRSNKGCEHRLIAKHIVMLRTTQRKVCIGGRSTHSTRIESFWRDHNVNIIINFRKEFEKLESLGCLDTEDNTDL